MRISTYGFALIAAGLALVAVAQLAPAGVHAGFDFGGQFGSGLAAPSALQAVIEPMLIGTALAMGVLFALPSLQAAWRRQAAARARGVAWCLRLVRSLRQRHYDNGAPVPLFMTGYGPYLA